MAKALGKFRIVSNEHKFKIQELYKNFGKKNGVL